MPDVLPIEKSLIKGTWDSTISNPLAESVVQGDFQAALTSTSAKRLFGSIDVLTGKGLAVVEEEDEIALLSLGVAALHAFVQANWTGPDLTVLPLDVIHVDGLNEQQLNEEIIPTLAYGGEPAYHLAQYAAFLRLAQIIFAAPFTHCRTAPWWRLRASLIHQQVLDEPVSLPSSLGTSLDSLRDDADIVCDPELKGRLVLEQGLLEHTFGHDRLAAELFVNAARATGLEYELTGALGKRTKFQQTELSQLVLLAESKLTLDGDAAAPLAESTPETLALNDDTLLEQTEFTSTTSNSNANRLSHLSPSDQPPLHPLDQSTLLALCLNVRNTSPKNGLTSEQMSPYVSRVISHPRNWSIHTMALLLRSRLESNRTRTVERATLQLQALVDQIPLDANGGEGIASAAERLRYVHALPLPSKWSLQRELAKAFQSLGAVRSAMEIFERLEMWEDVVGCFVALGKTDRAIDIVKDLLDGKKVEVGEMLERERERIHSDVVPIRRRPLDPSRAAKLHCILGDLQPQSAPTHYLHAWRTSNLTSARAIRSLGSYYFTKTDFPRAIACLNRSVRINPLHMRSWFMLGCAYVREEDWEGARAAFVRCVGIESEDGESWNNLASVYLRMGEAGSGTIKNTFEEFDEELDGIKSSTPAANTVKSSPTITTTTDDEDDPTQPQKIPFANKLLAFRALKQGLRFSYDNWRMWNNYMIVAVDVGELSEAARALARVVEETSIRTGADYVVDEDVLEKLVDAAVSRSNEKEDQDPNAPESNTEENLHLRLADLFTNTLLPRFSDSPRIFRAYARLLTFQVRWADALQAYLNAFACSSVGGRIADNAGGVDSWREGVAEVGDIVDVLRNFGERIDGAGDAPSGWRLKARSIVRTFMARTKESFGDEKEWVTLQEMLAELKN